MVTFGRTFEMRRRVSLSLPVLNISIVKLDFKTTFSYQILIP